jgi:hypothetical protein
VYKCRLGLGEEFFAESIFFALGEEYLHREFFSSPRIIFFTFGEELFAESSRFGSHQRLFLSAKTPFLVVLEEEHTAGMDLVYMEESVRRTSVQTI